MKKRFFTLTEILVVMALIVILGAIGFGSYRLATDSGRRSSTQAVLTQLNTAFKEIRSKSGSLPSTGGAFKTIKLTYTNGIVSKVTINGTDLSKEQLKIFNSLVNTESLKSQLDGDGNLVDDWGGKIYYAYPGKFNKTGVDLVAPGPDNLCGSDAAETPPTERSKYYSEGELVCDDVVNF